MGEAPFQLRLAQEAVRRVDGAQLVRIVRSAHARASPLKFIRADQRFNRASDPAGVIYAAETPETAILESLIRDRFEGADPRTINRAEIEDRSVVRFRADGPALLDMTGAAPARIGVPTDAFRARPHAAGRAFGEAVRTHLPEVNAILWPSRFTLADNIALFEGRGASLTLVDASPLIEEKAMADILESFAITPVDEG